MSRLLIIEDDEFTQKFYKLLFAKAGFNAIFMENGNEIVEFLDSNKVDLIIMDVNLTRTFLDGKKIDGISFATYLKNIEKFSNIPILVVTAHSNAQKIVDKNKNYCCDRVLVKPIADYKFMINTINELVSENDKQNCQIK